MITFNPDKPAELQSNRNHKQQFDHMMGRRRMHNGMQKVMIEQHSRHMDESTLQLNQSGIFKPLFWTEVDRIGIEVREDDRGREFMSDLMGIATPVPIGKTLKAYTANEDISKNYEISMAGNAVNDFDHIDYQNEADPIPIFSGGYGVNWRDWEGLKGEAIDVLGDSARAKKKVLMEAMADYLLTGSSEISVNGFKGQGVKNHRHTAKIDMKIDLTTATNDEVVNWFNQTLAIELDGSFVDALDVMWVSPDINRVLSRPFSTAAGFKEGTLRDYVMRFGKVKSIRQTYKLKGNEWLGYIRSREVITPLVGAALATVPLPRLMPHDNFNFLEWGAMGLQIKADVNGKSGVFYGAKLT